MKGVFMKKILAAIVTVIISLTLAVPAFAEDGQTDNASSTTSSEAAAKAVSEGECDRGIVICTTGIGISITANKVKGIRCALCSDTLSARMTREHNDANMLALGGGMVGDNLAIDIVDTFLDTEFSGLEKHSRRIALISKMEETK